MEYGMEQWNGLWNGTMEWTMEWTFVGQLALPTWDKLPSKLQEVIKMGGHSYVLCWYSQGPYLTTKSKLQTPMLPLVQYKFKHLVSVPSPQQAFHGCVELSGNQAELVRERVNIGGSLSSTLDQFVKFKHACQLTTHLVWQVRYNQPQITSSYLKYMYQTTQ